MESDSLEAINSLLSKYGIKAAYDGSKIGCSDCALAKSIYIADRLCGKAVNRWWCSESDITTGNLIPGMLGSIYFEGVFDGDPEEFVSDVTYYISMIKAHE
jgi:hypothetical protein